MSGDVTDKEAMILQAIDDGATDTVEIKEASMLTNRQINWRLVEKEDSLVDRGLVDTEQPDGWERRKHADREREHWAAKRVSLTDHGAQTVAKLDEDVGSKYEATSHDERNTRTSWRNGWTAWKRCSGISGGK